jgi:PAS domain S-box-containing protein
MSENERFVDSANAKDTSTDQRMGDLNRGSEILSGRDGLEEKVRNRFGVLPNFFRLTPADPEITKNLWGFAEFAYLDNPLPSLFKERLFVYLSRFCEVRYCIARHVGFLVGLGHPSADSPVQTVDQVVRLLQRPFPRGEELKTFISLCAAHEKPIRDLPQSDSDMEGPIFALACHVFLQTTEASICLDVLRSLFGERLQHLILFLTFVRTAHYWTKVHPDLSFEDDIKELLATQQALAECILNGPEVECDSIGKRILDELPLLRQEAHQATTLLAAIVASSDDAIVSKDLNGIISSWNQGAERIFGYTAEEAIGQHITLIIPPERHPEEKDILRRLNRGERIEHFETVRQRKDGTFVEVSLTISPIKDSAGRIVGASKVARDITSRKVAERSLATGARQQKALFRLANELIRALSINEVYNAALNAILDALQCNRASILLYDETGMMRFKSWRGLSNLYRAAVEGHSVWRTDESNPQPVWVSDINSADVSETLKKTVKTEGIAALAFIPLVFGGRLIGKFMTYYNNPHTFSNDEIELSLTIARQLSFAIERKRSEEALRESEERFRKLSETLDAQVRLRTEALEQQSEQVRKLSQQLLRIQDQERRHIARELHDSAGQTLVVIGMSLDETVHEADRVAPTVAKRLEDIQALVQQLHREIRTTSYLLHPPLLDESGLSFALNWYVEGLMARSGIAITLEIAKNVGRLPSDMELAIFRLVQESLTNIHRHSGSRTATIRVARDRERIRVEVRDQGKGIPSDRLAEIRSQGSGVGIRGIRERLKEFSGEMSIESSNCGTSVIVTIPVPKEAHSTENEQLHAAV